MKTLVTSFRGQHRRGILSLLLLGAFLGSLLWIPSKENLFHAGGWAIMGQMAQGILHPNLSAEIFNLGFEATLRTFSYAMAGMSVAVFLGFALGVPASGILSRGKRPTALQRTSKVFFRGLLGAMRSVHELVWAWIFVASIGLSPFAGIMAIGIPYGGILGRIYADMLNDVPEQPIRALRSSGASKTQQFFYGYLPMAGGNMLSYTLYRFECAIRSSSIMSFVGLGGLGYHIQRYMDDLDYSSTWTLLVFLFVLVIAVDLWSSSIRSKGEINKGRTPKEYKRSRHLAAFGMLMILAWSFIGIKDGLDFGALFSAKNQMHGAKFLHALLGGDEGLAYFSHLSDWLPLVKMTVDTFVMSIMAIGFATLAMLLTVLMGAKNVASGELLLSKGKFSWIFFYTTRGLFIVTRALPELIWAMIVIFMFKPGILPAAVALAIHNFGILGKLCAEVVEEMDTRAVKNLSACGANKIQILVYAIIPTVMPKFLTFILYRWEVIMRTTIVVGFVGAAGLGQHFKLSMSMFKYGEVSRTILCYLLLVVIADGLSEMTRRYIKN